MKNWYGLISGIEALWKNRSSKVYDNEMFMAETFHCRTYVN